MKLKKFGQFVNRINEEVNEEEFDNIEDFHNELGQEDTSDDEYLLAKSGEGRDYDDEGRGYDEDVEDDEDDADLKFGEEEEEEEGEELGREYEGTKELNKLAKKLGTKVVNNEIKYDGKVIHFYSETEKFHIGKDKFKTIPEVLDFLEAE